MWGELKNRCSQPLHKLLSPSLSPAVCQETKQTIKHLWRSGGQRTVFALFYASIQGYDEGGGRVAGADPPPGPTAPRRPALTWRPLPGCPAAGTVLFSGPGPAVRPGARRRARQAASSPRGGVAGGAVTMETAEAAAASEAAFGPQNSLLPQPRRPPSLTCGVTRLTPREAKNQLGKEGDKKRGRGVFAGHLSLRQRQKALCRAGRVGAGRWRLRSRGDASSPGRP